MKMRQTHYDELKRALQVISPTVKTRYAEKGLSHTRYLWDCFWYVCDDKLFHPEDVYNYLNDSHIETALKNIL